MIPRKQLIPLLVYQSLLVKMGHEQACRMCDALDAMPYALEQASDEEDHTKLLPVYQMVNDIVNYFLGFENEPPAWFKNNIPPNFKIF